MTGVMSGVNEDEGTVCSSACNVNIVIISYLGDFAPQNVTLTVSIVSLHRVTADFLAFHVSRAAKYQGPNCATQMEGEKVCCDPMYTPEVGTVTAILPISLFER